MWAKKTKSTHARPTTVTNKTKAEKELVLKQRAKADQGDGVTKRERSRREGGVRLAQEGRTFYLFEKEDGGPFAVQGGVRQPAVHHGRPDLPADPGVTTPSWLWACSRSW